MTAREIKRNINKTYCSVPQCYTEGSKNPTTSFHRFPTDMKLRLKWKYATKIGKQISNRMCVCSKHFKKNDYFYNGINVKRKRLKRIAVPSLNLPVTTAEVQKSVQEMILMKKARNVLSNSRYEYQRKQFNDNDFSTPFEEIQKETSKTNPDIVYLSVDSSNKADENSPQMEQYVQNVGIDSGNKDVDISEKAPKRDNTLDLNEEISNHFPVMTVDSNHSTIFDSISLTAALKQKLEEMTAQYEYSQKELKLCQERCRRYEKQITVLEKIVNNFKEITCVSDDS